MGKRVFEIWNQIPENYSSILLDESILMPNHLHGILILNPPTAVGAGPRACPNLVYPPCPTREGQPQGVAPTYSLSDMVHRFKSFTTAEYRKKFQQNGSPNYPRRLWLRNYYEHIIRCEEDFYKIRQYIRNNPLNWEIDKENTKNKKGTCDKQVP